MPSSIQAATLVTLLVGVLPLSSAPPSDHPTQDLFQAIRNSDDARLKQELAGGTNVNARGERATTPLMYAAAFGSLKAMQTLIDAGADVNLKNAFDATALMWCTSDLARVQLLVNKGADVNAKSKQGRTPLLIAASHDGNLPVVKLLMAKGADAKATDGFMNTALIAAAHANNTAMVKLFIEKGIDINAKNRAGDTALMEVAGSNNLDAVRALLKAGADVNAVSADVGLKVKNGPIAIGRLTALILATSYGSPELVKTLTDAGANVNAKDIRGMTPLMLAVSSEYQNPEVVQVLLEKGADPKAKSLAGETAVDWATKFGRPTVVSLFKGAPASAAAAPAIKPAASERVSPADIKKSVEKSVKLLQASSTTFMTEGGCAGCHHQQMTALTISAARGRGVAFNPDLAAAQIKIIKSEWMSAQDMLLQRIDPPAGTAIIAFGMMSLAATNPSPDSITDGVVCNVAAQQSADGGWHSGGLARPPMGDGDFSLTARGIRTLQAFGLPGRQVEFDQRIARARKWLEANAPRHNEDRNYQLLGLKWAGAESSALGKVAREILAEQRPDGGWAQNPHFASDAYATGETLYALNQTGMLGASDEAYQRGIAHLLKTQLADGSWHVKSRAVKFQPYFQSGFPHDHDQWISASATAWAASALALALPEQTAVTAKAKP
jgi:ankyrin repeat protein